VKPTTDHRATARQPEPVGKGELVDVSSPLWRHALDVVDHDIYHLPDYAAIAAESEGGTARAFHYRERDAVFLLPLLLRPTPGAPGRLDAATPYGYSGPVTNAADDEAFTVRSLASLIDTLRSHSVVTLFGRFHPLFPLPMEPYAEIGTVVKHGDTVSVDLSESFEQMWTHTRRGHRNQINRARRSGLSATFDDWSRFDEWVATYADNMRRLGAAERYLFRDAYFSNLRKRLADNVHLVTAAAPDGSFVGGIFLFERCGIVQAHLAATRWDHPLSVHAGKLLDDETRRWGKNRGALIYHLGGGFGGEQDSLFVYKSGFSDRRHPFHTWRVIVEPATYCALLPSSAADSAGFFPAYRSTDAGANSSVPRNSEPPISPSASMPRRRTT